LGAIGRKGGEETAVVSNPTTKPIMGKECNIGKLGGISCSGEDQGAEKWGDQQTSPDRQKAKGNRHDVQRRAQTKGYGFRGRLLDLYGKSSNEGEGNRRDRSRSGVSNALQGVTDHEYRGGGGGRNCVGRLVQQKKREKK